MKSGVVSAMKEKKSPCNSRKFGKVGYEKTFDAWIKKRAIVCECAVFGRVSLLK